METPQIELYLGTVLEVKDRETYEITASIPGVAESVRCYPFSRGEMDEPVPGNTIYLLSVDPVYHSFYLYTKAKENSFVGIRSNGKMVDITPEEIRIGTYDSSTTSPDDTRPELENYIKISASGDIEIMGTGNSKVEISGNSEVKIGGSADINVDGDCTLKSPNVTVTGGKLNVKGSVSPTGGGPFNCIPVCPFVGQIHQGNSVSGT